MPVKIELAKCELCSFYHLPGYAPQAGQECEAREQFRKPVIEEHRDWWFDTIPRNPNATDEINALAAKGMWHMAPMYRSTPRPDDLTQDNVETVGRFLGYPLDAWGNVMGPGGKRFLKRHPQWQVRSWIHLICAYRALYMIAEGERDVATLAHDGMAPFARVIRSARLPDRFDDLIPELRYLDLGQEE